MKAIYTSLSPPHTTTTPILIKIVSFSLLSFTLFFIFKYLSAYTPPTPQNQHLSFFNTTRASTLLAPPPKEEERPILERTGIINELGVMTEDFVIGEFDEGVIESLVVMANSSDERERGGGERGVIKIEKFRACEMSLSDYIPCLDNVYHERHCPEKGKGLDCLVPRPKGYKIHIPWPESRYGVWFDNVPRTLSDKGGQNGVSRKDDKLIFAGDGPQFIRGTDKYLDQISKMVPEIAFGQHTRVALDIGSGLADFGAYLLERNVTTLSIAPKDVKIQLAMERGVPAMVATFGRRNVTPLSAAGMDNEGGDTEVGSEENNLEEKGEEGGFCYC